MSQDWINRERLEESGLKSHEVDQVLDADTLITALEQAGLKVKTFADDQPF